MFFSAPSLAHLLALHLLSPWYLLLLFNGFASLANAAIPLASSAVNTALVKFKEIDVSNDALPHPRARLVIAFIIPAAATLSVCTLIIIGLAKQCARVSRSSTQAKKNAAAERQKHIEGKSAFERKVAAAKLWHGGGQTPMAVHTAALQFEVGQNTLRLLLDRAFAAYNNAHPLTPLRCLEDFRSMQMTVFTTYLTPAECGRGDKLSEWEFTEIQSRYKLRCKNYKDVPESELKNDSSKDDFAKTINEVFAESRVARTKKKTAEEYSNFAIRKWAREMDVVSTGTVPGSDSRSAAVGDWRNMISSLVMWLTVTASFSKPIPPSCLYNMDDTTVFLEQKFGRRGKKTFVSKDVKDGLRGKHLSFSFGITKSKRDKQRKKSRNTQARTVKILLCTCGDGSAICTVIKIKDESIREFKIQPVNVNLYIVWDPKIAKTGSRAPAEPKAVRVKRTALILQHCILPPIVADLAMKRSRQASSVRCFYEDGSRHSSQDSHAADECYDRAILCMDGDFAQIEAILEIESMTQAFADENVELFKFAAGASMSQQPNDRSRCFYCLKKALHEQRMKIQQDIALSAACVEPKLRKALRELAKQVPDKGKSKTSFATFNFFLSSCDAIFNNAFTIANVRSGWQKCGLAPFNPKMMMVSYAFFEDLEAVAPDAADQVLAAMPRLSALAREAGYISDEQMQLELGGLFDLSPAFAATYLRNSANQAPVNHRRCIWLSNPAFLASERQQRQQRAVQGLPPAARAPAQRAQPQARAANGAASDIPWSFPCMWTSADQSIHIDCGSKDKCKTQHLDSGKHKKFLQDVADAQMRMGAFEESEYVEQEAEPIGEQGSVDPLHLVVLNTNLANNFDDDDDYDSDDDALPVFRTPAHTPVGTPGSTPVRGRAAAKPPRRPRPAITSSLSESDGEDSPSKKIVRFEV